MEKSLSASLFTFPSPSDISGGDNLERPVKRDTYGVIAKSNKLY